MLLDGNALHEAALRALPLAGLHHLAIFTVAAIIWARRESARTVLSAYMSGAFATAAAVLLWSSGTRPYGLLAIALAVVWLRETTNPRGELAFRRTPRPRLALMAAAAALALCYPGYSGGLPPFIFSPVGVTLQPTVILSLALLNASEGPTNRTLHWILAIVGAALGVAGAARGEWLDVSLLLLSGHAGLLLIRGGRLLPDEGQETAGSVEDIRRRMYARRSFLPGPRDPRRRPRASGRR